MFWEISSRINYGVQIEDRVPDFDFDIACDSEAVYVGRGSELLSLDLGDGRIRWVAPLKGLGGGPMLGGWVPMVSNGLVVINVGNGTAAFSAATGELRWVSPHAGGRAIYDGRLYLVGQGNYYVLEVATGQCALEVALSDRVEKKWKLRGVGFPTHIGISETHGFVGDYRGRLYAFERETGEPVWKHQPEGIVGFTGNVPVIAGNRLYISSFSMDPARPPRLYCYEGSS